jgi:pilus assembly protein Flp/PilA
MMTNVTERVLAMFNAADNGEEGQGLVEYALIIALVSILLVGALTALSTGIGNQFSTIVGSM